VKLREIRDGLMMFMCPGCKYHHTVWVVPGDHPTWTYNGNPDLPTFTPSLLLYTPALPPSADWPRGKPQETLCHSFVTDGRIQFLPDSAHELAGKTVDLPEWTEGE
jgi:hypothetical protein